MSTTMLEKMADAMESAEFEYSLRLTRLVDGVSTYTLNLSDRSPALEFDDIQDGYAHIAKLKRRKQALAALAAIRDVSPRMMEAGSRAVCLAEGDNPDAMHGGIRSWTLCSCQALPAFEAMIDAIISEARA